MLRARPRRTARVAAGPSRRPSAIVPAAWPAPIALTALVRPAARGSSNRGRFVPAPPRVVVASGPRPPDDASARAARRGGVRDRLGALTRAGARPSGPGAAGRCARRDGGRRAVVEHSRRRDRDCRRGPRSSTPAVVRMVARARRSGGGAGSELLDRYLLVSQIAPQLQHVIDLVRPVYGVTVTSVVACGNLPDLRSLAMLLIEEMDLEVETLDSAELLEPGVAPGTLDGCGRVAPAGGRRRIVGREPRAGSRGERAWQPDGEACARRARRRNAVWPGARLQSLAALVVLAFCAGVVRSRRSSARRRPLRIFPAGHRPRPGCAVSQPLGSARAGARERRRDRARTEPAH